MRYTFSLSRGGAFAVASAAVTGTALVFAAGLLVGAAAAVPDAPPTLAVADSSAERADSAAAAEVEVEMASDEEMDFEECEPPAAVVSWEGWTGSGGQLAPLRAVDLPGYEAQARPLRAVRPVRLPDYTGGPDPYEVDDADGRTMGTFADEEPALALMKRIREGGVESFIDARLGPDGAPVFRVRTGSPEEES